MASAGSSTSPGSQVTWSRNARPRPDLRIACTWPICLRPADSRPRRSAVARHPDLDLPDVCILELLDRVVGPGWAAGAATPERSLPGTESPEGPEDTASRPSQLPLEAALRARELRRAERELRRALSEGRAFALVAGSVLLAHVSFFSLLAGHPWLAVTAGGLSFVCLVWAPFDEPPQPRPPKAEIWRLSNPEFDRLVEASEADAASLAGAIARPADHLEDPQDSDFELMISDALDELPEFVRSELESGVVVVVADDGAAHGTHGYYGLYHGGTVNNLGSPHRVTIFRDTLVRDFGDDPQRLRREVARVVRHELAHHLGASELQVGKLGL